MCVGHCCKCSARNTVFKGNYISQIVNSRNRANKHTCNYGNNDTQVAVSCSQPWRLKLEYILNVHISNLVFTGCVFNNTNKTQSNSVQFLHFEKRQASAFEISGGAIIFNNSFHVYISECTWSGNVASHVHAQTTYSLQVHTFVDSTLRSEHLEKCKQKH